MSTQDTPPRNGNDGLGREKTPEVPRRRERDSDVREKDDKERSRRRRDDDDYESERRRRHRHRDETDDDREERRKRRRDDETEEEREERRRRRKERERERERERGRDRSASRESHRSQRSHRSHRSSARDIDMDRERLREREDERRMAEDRRRRDDRERGPRYDERRDSRYDGPRRGDVYVPRDLASPMTRSPPPRERRGSPAYGRRMSNAGTPKRDEAEALLNDVDSEARSIFVSQLAAALTSRDVGMFFEDKLGKGSVRDARVVTDRITRRSKGVAYVELASVELVSKALSLSGTIVMGLPIMIALSESEKNITHAVMPSMPGAPMVGPGSLPPSRPVIPGLPPTPENMLGNEATANAAIPYHRLYVGNLYYNLTADDIRQVFEPFGELAFVEMPMEPHTNRSRGYAFVQFKDLAPAEMALASMNGFELAGRAIKVSTVHERGTGTLPRAQEILEDTSATQGTRMDASARQELMFKLARQPDPRASTSISGFTPSTALMRPNIPVQQTQYVQLSNMFDPATENEPNWHLDLEEDIKEEVEAKYGKVDKLVVDKNSPDGHVFIKFADTTGASRGIAGLNGRFFSAKKITAHYISEAIFKAHAP
ncbi:Phosphatidylinositol-3-phosphatase SAC1, variant 2 [Naganishia albida]|nr:Phosphatidylinositol-3-phosphatase SAC1, variant 2 [Naganishia albida]